ncbi:MAG: hypothetical protein LBR93_09460 [Treponema sp.]|jgi:hypothetical protein|nr:hypothetical protein [Treponema sp.]
MKKRKSCGCGPVCEARDAMEKAPADENGGKLFDAFVDLLPVPVLFFFSFLAIFTGKG